jgi:hypothetical protein
MDLLMVRFKVLPSVNILKWVLGVFVNSWRYTSALVLSCRLRIVEIRDVRVKR